MMELIIRSVSKNEFYSSDFYVLFNDVETEKYYGLLSKNGYGCRFSWQSALVDPKVINVDFEVFGVGIDLNFAIVDFANKNVSLSINLDTFF